MNDQFEFVSYYKYSSAKVLVLLDDDGYISGRALGRIVTGKQIGRAHV